jgi:hypothetical protein
VKKPEFASEIIKACFALHNCIVVNDHGELIAEGFKKLQILIDSEKLEESEDEET